MYDESVFPEVARGVGMLCIPAANDIVALARVRLPPNTRAHHTVVLGLSLLNLRDALHPAHMLAELCAFSMVPFVVNVYLGVRKLDGPLARALAPIGLATYAPAVALNIVRRQGAAIRRTAEHAPATACAWAALFAAIVWDDVLLMRHLARSVSADHRWTCRRRSAAKTNSPSGPRAACVRTR